MIRVPPTRYILPNLFTLAATFCGFAIIWLAQSAETAADFYNASMLVPIACLLDGFDGRIARLVHGESKFGMHLDSLSDGVTFGVAPAVLMFHWALEPLGFAGLCVAFAFAACALIRLARFNVEAEHEVGVARYFQGLPAPMAGMAIAALIAVHTSQLGHETLASSTTPWVIAYVCLMALLMVSNVPFRTFKDLKLTTWNRLLVASVLATVCTVGAMTNLMVGLGFGLGGYISLHLTGLVLFRKRRRIRIANENVLIEEDEDDEIFVDEITFDDD